MSLLKFTMFFLCAALLVAGCKRQGPDGRLIRDLEKIPPGTKFSEVLRLTKDYRALIGERAHLIFESGGSVHVVFENGSGPLLDSPLVAVVWFREDDEKQRDGMVLVPKNKRGNKATSESIERWMFGVDLP